MRRYSGGLLDWEDAGLPLEGSRRREDDAGIADRARRPSHPYAAEIEAERPAGTSSSTWSGSLSPRSVSCPATTSDPDWTVRDVVAHLGTWLAEAEVQFERSVGGTYEGHDVDVDALNAELLAAMDGQPWDVAWMQAKAGGPG